MSASTYRYETAELVQHTTECCVTLLSVALLMFMAGEAHGPSMRVEWRRESPRSGGSSCDCAIAALLSCRPSLATGTGPGPAAAASPLFVPLALATVLPAVSRAPAGRALAGRALAGRVPPLSGPDEGDRATVRCAHAGRRWEVSGDCIPVGADEGDPAPRRRARPRAHWRAWCETGGVGPECARGAAGRVVEPRGATRRGRPAPLVVQPRA